MLDGGGLVDVELVEVEFLALGPTTRDLWQKRYGWPMPLCIAPVGSRSF